MNSSNSAEQKRRWERIRALEKELEQYQKYLEDKCGYEIPMVSSTPMVQKMETWEY